MNEELAKSFVRDEIVPLDKLKPHPKNPRLHPDSLIDKLVESMKRYDLTVPMVVTEDYTVLSGHARLKAAQRLGLKELPVRVHNFSDEDAILWMIDDNRLQDESDWNLIILKDDLEPLAGMDLKPVGFTDSELDIILHTDGDFGFDIGTNTTHSEKDYTDLQGEVTNRSYVAMVHFSTKEKAEAFLTYL